MARKGTAKLSDLRSIESSIQQLWALEHLFESDIPSTPKEKFFITFPYPYMNGRLHLGHAFSITKAEYAAGYQALRGKAVLWPMGFHCTGTPIKASADKLAMEIKLYGCPPVFPAATAVVDQTKQTNDTIVVDKSKSKKSKAVAKTGGIKYQWQILASMGISPQEIPKFTDPTYWLKYFPDWCMNDLMKMGLKVSLVVCVRFHVHKTPFSLFLVGV